MSTNLEKSNSKNGHSPFVYWRVEGTLLELTTVIRESRERDYVLGRAGGNRRLVRSNRDRLDRRIGNIERRTASLGAKSR